MPHFFESPLPKRRLWIHNSAECWRRLTGLWKMVSRKPFRGDFNHLSYKPEAGMPLEKVAGSKTSVHTGCFLDDYQQIAFKDSEQCASSFGLSMGRCMLANRISWFFNFTGTSCQVDTACSSTLVALHLACNELINGDANTVLC